MNMNQENMSHVNMKREDRKQENVKQENRNQVTEIEDELFERYPQLAAVRGEIKEVYRLILDCYRKSGKLMICGNGGSASDADHIVGELMKGFRLKRPLQEKDKLRFRQEEDSLFLTEHLQKALPAISLCSHTALITAFSNDVAPDMVFAQQVYGWGHQEDIFLALSTSGNSGNVVNAVKVARGLGIKTVGITGRAGGMLKNLCSSCLCLPAVETYKIQELTLPVYHALCAMLEEEFFGE